MTNKETSEQIDWKQRAYEMLEKAEQLQAKVEQLSELLREANGFIQECRPHLAESLKKKATILWL